MKYRCTPHVKGSAEGNVLFSSKPFAFAHGVDPKTGLVTDIRSDALGKRVKGMVVVYLYGKGSTTGSAWFLETARCGNAPSAVITKVPDNSAIIGSIISGMLYGTTIPVLSTRDDSFFNHAKNSRFAKINESGDVELE